MRLPREIPEEWNDLPGEEWRPVSGWEGFYDVSNLGRVKRVGKVRGATVGRVLKGAVSWGTYRWVSLRKYDVAESLAIHVLVAAAWLGKRPDGKEVNHIDGNKLNNCAVNLEYVTKKENCQHAYDIGIHKRIIGEDVPWSVLREPDVLRIRELRRQRAYTIREIASMFHVSEGCISGIVKNRTWKHLLPLPSETAALAETA